MLETTSGCCHRYELFFCVDRTQKKVGTNFMKWKELLERPVTQHKEE